MRSLAAATSLLLSSCAISGAAVPPLRAELASHLKWLEAKLVEYATAVPPNRYSWRPAPAMRSFSEAVLHVAATNSEVAAMVRRATRPIDPAALERSTTDKAEVLARVRSSFADLRAALRRLPAAELERPVSFHGRLVPARDVFYKQALHAAQHLGQLNVYRRLLRQP